MPGVGRCACAELFLGLLMSQPEGNDDEITSQMSMIKSVVYLHR